LIILLLLGDSEIAQGASPKTTFDEKAMQVDQRGGFGMRRTDLHAGVQAAKTMITPGAVSTRTTRPLARCSLLCCRTRRP
jgi:hypothetical protein